MKDTTKVYLYLRVSTAIQVEGYSLEAQEQELRRYAEIRNFHIVKTYRDEGISGKSVTGRPAFMSMLEDIKAEKGGVRYVLVFKLSRFGRNAADVLSSLQTMQDYGVDLICVKDSIDSSAESGKLIISVLAAVAEIERENIRTQTMAGRMQKAREGRWNGGFAPYGYKLVDGALEINEEEAEAIRLIFDKYTHTSMGAAGVAKWMRDHGIRKTIRQNGRLDTFSVYFIKKILDNPVYCGKIAYGRRGREQIKGARGQSHIVQKKEYQLYEGIHEAIVSEELWTEAHTKRMRTGHKKEKIEREHEYILSGLIKCPVCGKHMYGVPMRGKKRKDGTLYPTYYSYICRSSDRVDGTVCTWKRQISARILDKAVEDTILQLVNSDNFKEIMDELMGSQLDTADLERQIETLRKNLRNTRAAQVRIEEQLDSLDFDDPHYERLYESLTRRLEGAFDKIEDIEHQRQTLETRVESIKEQQFSRESVYKYLTIFDQVYYQMTDGEKKSFMQSFIESIDIWPEKQQSGTWLKTLHFRFPIAYQGDVTETISLPKENTVETIVLLQKLNS